MATTDDFTFQITTATLPCPIDSPPLWHSTSTPPSPSPSCFEISAFDGEEVLNTVKSRSFSDVELGVSNEDGEEKMDMLWENLNEEFSKKCGLDSNVGNSPGRFVKLECVRGVMVVKKHGTMSLLKVLKKLFLLRSFQRSLKKRKL